MNHVEVAVAVIVHASKILCVRRGHDELPYVAFKWEFPGGKIEEDESPSNALEREIQEELRIKIKVGDKIMTIDHEYPDFHVTMHAHFCNSETNVIALTEHIAYEWCDADELHKFDWLEADIPLIDKLTTV